jgi:hypothetical protein
MSSKYVGRPSVTYYDESGVEEMTVWIGDVLDTEEGNRCIVRIADGDVIGFEFMVKEQDGRTDFPTFRRDWFAPIYTNGVDVIVDAWKDGRIVHTGSVVPMDQLAAPDPARTF